MNNRFVLFDGDLEFVVNAVFIPDSDIFEIWRLVRFEEARTAGHVETPTDTQCLYQSSPEHNLISILT